MRRKIFNIILLLTSFCLMLSISFAWWTEGVSIDSFLIKSANISSIITIYEGSDFNHDGNLDNIDDSTTEDDERFTKLKTTEKNDKQVLVLQFPNLIPTEVYTWKITVENNGDAAGYVYCSLWDEISTLTDQQKLMIKYMSIKIMGKADSTKVYIGNALNDMTGQTKIITPLFGGSDTDIVDIGKTKDYIFQIQVETFENLVDAGVCSDTAEEKAEYQSIQGKFTSTTEVSFKFLDVVLSSETLNKTE